MTYYSVNKILEIMKMYSIYKENVRNYKREHASVGVAQLGIEATMPKANTISDVVADEALKHVEDVHIFAEMKTDIKYLEDRWHRVTGEQDEKILSLRLDGYSAWQIARVSRCSERKVYNRLESIARMIGGFAEI